MSLFPRTQCEGDGSTTTVLSRREGLHTRRSCKLSSPPAACCRSTAAPATEAPSNLPLCFWRARNRPQSSQRRITAVIRCLLTSGGLPRPLGRMSAASGAPNRGFGSKSGAERASEWHGITVRLLANGLAMSLRRWHTRARVTSAEMATISAGRPNQRRGRSPRLPHPSFKLGRVCASQLPMLGVACPRELKSWSFPCFAAANARRGLPARALPGRLGGVGSQEVHM